jgi:hypothetical protein
MTVFISSLVVAVLLPFLLQLLKKYATAIQNSKLLSRLIVIGVALLGAVIVQMTTTGTVDWDLALKSAAGIVVTAEFSYQWILKYLGDLATTKK